MLDCCLTICLVLSKQLVSTGCLESAVAVGVFKTSRYVMAVGNTYCFRLQVG